MRARVLAVVLLILSVAPAIAQEKSGYRYTSTFFPLGVRDADGKTAYVAAKTLILNYLQASWDCGGQRRGVFLRDEVMPCAALRRPA